jgi:hypothetical protein
MRDADLALKALLEVDEPPARDPAFSLAVMERIERRRFWMEVAMGAPVALAVLVALWALSPLLTEAAVQWIGPFAQGVLMPVLAVVMTLVGLALSGREQARA